MPKILMLTWILEGTQHILADAKEVEVSQSSANLNLSINQGVQYPSYASMMDKDKYLTAVIDQPKKGVDHPTAVVTDDPIAGTTTETEAPIYKTKAEKIAAEKAAKDAENNQ